VRKFVYRGQAEKRQFGGSAAERVYFILQEHGLKAAQDAFRKEFGVPYNDRSIGRKVREIFERSLNWDADVTGSPEVPQKILVAILLHKGLGGRGLGPQSKAHARAYNDAVDMREMRSRKQEVRATTTGMPTAQIDDKVADEFSAPGRTRHSKSGIRRRLQRRR
jgi:hypothetical protein